MKDFYHYFAILEPNKQGYGVYFPDLNGCVTQGEDYKEAIKCAKEVLEFHLYGMEKDNDPIPEPSKPEDIEVPQGSIMVLIEANIKLFKHSFDNKSVTRAITLPRKLNEMAKDSDMNVSAVVQDAIKEYLGIKED